VPPSACRPASPDTRGPARCGPGPRSRSRYHLAALSRRPERSRRACSGPAASPTRRRG
jgi:hypothetical protein